MHADMSRRVAAEALGTGLLVTAVVGSGIMAERLTDDVAFALLGNTLSTGAVLFVLITLLGPISGAHLNPAVSVVMALQRALPWSAAVFYIGAQVIGGVVGTTVAHLMFEAPALSLGDQVRTGPAQWLSEGIATFGLLLTILVGAGHRPTALPALVASYIIAAYWFTASTSFANPAVAIARAFTDTFSGIRPIDVVGFIAAQLAGAILAMACSQWLVSKAHAA